LRGKKELERGKSKGSPATESAEKTDEKKNPEGSVERDTNQADEEWANKNVQTSVRTLRPWKKTQKNLAGHLSMVDTCGIKDG